LACFPEAGVTVNRLAVSGLERDRRFYSALSAGNARLIVRLLPLVAAFCRAQLATPRVVLEILLVKEGLFFSGKNEGGPAIAAGQ
jgi:hypothetical protein